MRYLILCFLFFITDVYADPVRLYDIINIAGVEFVPIPGEINPQCQEFSKISALTRSSKLIDFDSADKHNCTALTKNNETCGLNIILNARKIPQIQPFGNCHLITKVQKETQRIDRVYIGLTQ